MSTRWKRGITVAILLIVLLAFVITSFGCKTLREEKSFPDGEQTADMPAWLTPPDSSVRGE